MAEVEQAQNPNQKKRFRINPVFKNPIFIFTVAFVLFLLSIFALLVLDTGNTMRPTWLNFISNWLRSIGIVYNVTMTTWLITFIVFMTFFAIFFIRLFRRKLQARKARKIMDKEGRDITPQEIKRFKVKFYLIVVGILVAILAGGLVFFGVKGFFPIIGSQLTNFGQEIVNFLLTLVILIALLLVVPVTLVVLYLVFKLLVTIISLFVSGVSNSVMRSQAYQENKAATQAAADDISDAMRAARGRAKDAVNAARNAQSGGSGGGRGAEAPTSDYIFPALTNIDMKWAKILEEREKEAEEAKKLEEAKEAQARIDAAAPIANPDAPKEENNTEVVNPDARPPLDYEQFKRLAFEFQSYLCHQKYYFKINTLRSFIAGLAAARLILLQGLSGTGKSTLPRVFLEYVGGKAYFFPVQATWRDRSDITGYYSDFTGQFKETELLKHLYEASYTPETCNLMVLDEMNISRVEYYFADFLSIFEYPSADWVVPLMQVKPGTVLPKYIENGMVRIPVNTWFVGTVNIDDSTFTITDKVYDRAIAIDFNELNLPFESSYRYDPHPIKIQELVAMFQECKDKPENHLTPAERKKFLDLTQFISDTFDIQFGNRIMNQIDNFLPVFVGLGGTKNEALDVMIARKVLRKLEGKFESYIKDGLNKLTRYLNANYGKRALPESEAVIEKYRRKLS